MKRNRRDFPRIDNTILLTRFDYRIEKRDKNRIHAPFSPFDAISYYFTIVLTHTDHTNTASGVPTSGKQKKVLKLTYTILCPLVMTFVIHRRNQSEKRKKKFFIQLNFVIIINYIYFFTHSNPRAFYKTSNDNNYYYYWG